MLEADPYRGIDRGGRIGGRGTDGGDWSTSGRREQDNPFGEHGHSTMAREADSPCSYQEKTLG
jgi:hypothetical protein